ncbi:MAG: hypothetical protein WAO15_04340 [Mycobacterium sp.]
MKLARPDIRHHRIVLAGCRRSVESDRRDNDDAGLVPALRKRGLHARWLPWDDPDTLRADLVILRATADYTERQDEFLGWTRRVSNLLNPPDVVAWNIDKRHLRDLASAGVPLLGTTTEPSASLTALVFIGGVQSHAFTAERAVEPDFEVWDLGHAALQAAAAHVGIGTGELLYARIDVTGGPGDARLVGLDLIAPSLGWRRLDAGTRELAQRNFALAVESACERLGLGPLSQPFPH